MASVDSSSADVIVFSPKASKPPPATTVGVLGWFRENLFYSWFSTALTFACGYLIFITVAALYQWGVADAVWDAESRRQCLDTSPHGACWAGIVTWFNAIIYGRFPDPEQWRVNLGFILLFLWMAPLWFPRLKGKVGVGITLVLVYPFLAAYLFAGGERGWFMQFMVILAVTTFINTWLNIILSFTTGRTLGEWIVGLTGFADKHERLHKYPNLGFIAIIFAIVFFVLHDWSVVAVKTNLWGGLFLTLVIAGVAIVTALPGGIVLALGRRSHMPVVRISAIAFIELFRSVPLITVLFMAVTMMPLFLPADVQLNKLVQVIIGVCLFAAAYMAEVVRGGLQAVPNGQYEAAKAMGLTYWKSMNLIILPQALKLMIPNIVGNFIGLLKDTTLVSIIGLYDMLGMLKATGQNPIWIGLHTEPLMFGAAVYFILCFAMSQYSQSLERKLKTTL
jgi:general L-amino acid transport system permease protein